MDSAFEPVQFPTISAEKYGVWLITGLRTNNVNIPTQLENSQLLPTAPKKKNKSLDIFPSA